MPTLITPGSPRSFFEQGSVFAWVSFARAHPLQVGQFSVSVNTWAFATGDDGSFATAFFAAGLVGTFFAATFSAGAAFLAALLADSASTTAPDLPKPT
jgi:hypothetical protein